ncbi:Hsp20/alpha crystallin family protein [Anaerolineae bacterium]|nr:Hsp20/alpha crystallin family protein [Anaerolineae bacterium]
MQFVRTNQPVPLQRLLHALVEGSAPAYHDDYGRTLPVDVREEPGRYIISASLPGVTPDTLHIQLEQDVLVIRGETPAPDAAQGYVLRERHAVRFYRQLRLPHAVEAAAASAQLQHGVLTLSLPKAAAAQSSRIAVTAL